jgi:acetyl esterase
MARDRGGPPLTLQILIYPILDATMSTVSRVVSRDPVFNMDCELSMLGAYVPLLTDVGDPRISLVNAKSLRDLPPTLIVVGKDDPVRDEVDMYANRLKAAGVSVGVSDYPNGIHRFFLLAGALDAGKRAIDEIAAGLKRAFQNGN